MENPFNKYKVNAVDSLFGVFYFVAAIAEYEFITGTVAPALEGGGVDLKAVLFSFPELSLFGISYSLPDLTYPVAISAMSVILAFLTNARFADDRFSRSTESRATSELMKRFRAARSKWSPVEFFGALISWLLVIVPYFISEIEAAIVSSVYLQIFFLVLGVLGFTAVGYDTDN